MSDTNALPPDRGIGGTGMATPVAAPLVTPPFTPPPALTPEQIQAKQADKIEADKAARAKAGLTAAPSGLTGQLAFGGLVSDAKFVLRNQGHTFIEDLLDDMLAGIERLEAKLAGA